MKGMGPFKIIIDVAVVIAALHMIIRGFAAEAVEPFILALIGIIILVEQFSDLFHAH